MNDNSLFRDYYDNRMSIGLLHVLIRGEPERFTIQALNRDYMGFLQKPLDKVTFTQSEDNICKWYFLIHGSENTLFEGGLYMGVIFFPLNFPFSAPEIQMILPTARFVTRVSICLTMTNYHQELWSPLWSVEKLLLAFTSFMNSSDYGIGCFPMGKYNDQVVCNVALGSKRWLVNNCKLFPVIFPNEAYILKKAISTNTVSYVLNDSLQTQNRFDIVRRRLHRLIENQSIVFAQVEELPAGKLHKVIHEYLLALTSVDKVNNLGVPFLIEESFMENYISDDEMEEEIELYSEGE